MNLSKRRAVQAAGTIVALGLLAVTVPTSAQAMVPPPDPIIIATAPAAGTCVTHRTPVVIAPRFADKAPMKSHPPRKCRSLGRQG